LTRADLLAAERDADALIAARAKADPAVWARLVLSDVGQWPARHHELLLSELDAVADGRIDRLLVTMPPGSAKSTYVSVLFPPHFLSRHPRACVIAASHTVNLAEHFGRQVRNLVAERSATLGYALSADNAAAGRWGTTTGGQYLAAGVGMAIAGRRADLIVIDDPVKTREAAWSETEREKTWAWYRTDLYTRLKPGGRIVLVMTRWHTDDLGGRLLAEMEAGAGDKWHVLNLPALAEDNDPLGRAQGEALWPSWEDTAALARKRAVLGEMEWSALFQQRPVAAEGLLFMPEKIGVVPAVPAGGMWVRAWDLAATAGDGDWTAGVKLGRCQAGNFVVADVVRLQGSPQAVEAAIVNTAAQDGKSVQVGLPQDPGQAGKVQVAYLTSKLAGYRVVSSTETGDKATRAGPVASQVEVGNVSLLAGPWNRTLIDELRDFPAGRHDDQVDALSRAFAMLIGRGPMVIGQEALRRA
jgi:predicted phage terminase large subunit-like protein